MKRYKVLSGLGVAAMVGLMAMPAGAVPKGESLALNCKVLSSISITLSPGNGVWTPGFVTGSNQRLIPYALRIVFTPKVGPPVIQDVSKPAPNNGRLDTCTFSGSDADGTFTGVVSLSYTPAK